MRVGMITTFQTPCGVAKYTEELCYELNDLVDLTVFGERIQSNSIEDPPIYPKRKPIFLNRCWSRADKCFGELYSDIINSVSPFDVVHIQFESAMYNEGMYSQSALLTFLNKLKEAEIKTVMTLHNVPQFNAGIPYTNWYKNTGCRFIVTNDLMKKELYKWQPEVQSTTIKLGSTLFEPMEINKAKDLIVIPRNKFVITQTGFYGYDKGMLGLIEAMPRILEKIPEAYLVLAGSIHPLAPPIHRTYLRKCIQTAVHLGLQNYIRFTGKFLNEQDLSLYLSASDIVAVNHQYVFGLFSSSASAHRAIGAGKPMIMNYNDVRLSEFIDGKHCLKAEDKDIPDGVFMLYNMPELREKLYKGASEYAKETSYLEIAKQHLKVYKK